MESSPMGKQPILRRPSKNRSQILIKCRNHLIVILPIPRPINLQIVSKERKLEKLIQKQIIKKNSGDGIHPCRTQDDKEHGVDFTPSTSTTIERSRRNDEITPIAEV
jgi:hypothetical protein